MFTHTLFLAAALVSISASPLRLPDTACGVVAPVGGSPSISVANKASGDINKAEWSAIKTIELQGCVPDARLTSLTICIKDCTNKAAFAKGADATVTSAMRTMIANLPPSTPFTVKVVVKDAKGKVWDVPDAHFIWKG